MKVLFVISVVKKIFLIVSMLAFLTATLLFGGNLNNKACAAPAKVLKVGTNVGYIPFAFKTDNKSEIQDFDVDLIKAVAEKNELQS